MYFSVFFFHFVVCIWLDGCIFMFMSVNVSGKKITRNGKSMFIMCCTYVFCIKNDRYTYQDIIFFSSVGFVYEITFWFRQFCLKSERTISKQDVTNENNLFIKHRKFIWDMQMLRNIFFFACARNSRNYIFVGLF